MLILISGLALAPLFSLFYWVSDFSITIDKKQKRIIISTISPPLVIKFSDIIYVELIKSNDLTPSSTASCEGLQKMVPYSLKITVANMDKPVYVSFTRSGKKNIFKYSDPEKSANTLYKKLSAIIKINNKSQTRPAKRAEVRQLQPAVIVSSEL